MTPEEKQIRNLTKSLIEISNDVLTFLELMDRTMKLPSTEERGKTIAGYLNALEFTNASVRHFVLGAEVTDKKPLKYKRPTGAKVSTESRKP